MAKKKAKKAGTHGGPRKGSGRPRKYEDSVNRSVLMPTKLLDRIEAEAERKETSINALIVAVLDKGVK